MTDSELEPTSATSIEALQDGGHALARTAMCASTDLTIEPLRERLATLAPPRPLSFERLMFRPLDLLIVPSGRWRPGHLVIPRPALAPMAEHVRLAMGSAAAAIEAEIAGRTTADTGLIARLGRSVWPEAASVLHRAGVPETWRSGRLGDAGHRPLAGVVSALLAEAVTLVRIQAEAATGLLPPPPHVVEAMLSRVGAANAWALPMLIAVLLDHLPGVATLLPAPGRGRNAAATKAAIDAAAGLLLRQLDQADEVEMRIATGTLTDAGVAASRMVALLKHVEASSPQPERRGRARAVRRRLDDACRARFTFALRDEFLAPLHAGAPDDPPALEVLARGLRVLESEARLAGSGAAYDRLLREAAAAVGNDAARNGLSAVDRIRLVEILSGPEAALAMLGAAA